MSQPRISCHRDVADLRQAEEALKAAGADLAHASRLILTGALTASIAHEITQPVTAIVGNASAALAILQRDEAFADSRELTEILGDIVAQGRQAAEVIQRLRLLARKRPLLLQAVDINEVAKDTLHFLGGDAGRRHVVLKADLEPALPLVQADRVCFQQVLVNLFLNAMDAMAHLEPARRHLFLSTRRAEQGVEIVVADSGHGIAAEAFPNLFEAFFTTKKDGVGLGLAIAQSIIEAHRGRIWAENGPAGGAVFRIALPPLESSAQARAIGGPKARSPAC